MIGELVSESALKKAEYGKRSRAYDEESFETALQATREAEGWVLYRENKTTVRMRRPKRFDEVLENRFWSILYRFGYSDLNKGRSFKVAVGKGEERTLKQVDVFAKDDETLSSLNAKHVKRQRSDRF